MDNQENCYSKYTLDRDIPDILWRNYLLKYEDKYQMITDGDGFWCIKCSRGRIGTYSILQKMLYFSTNDLSKKAATFFLRKLRKYGEEIIVVTQSCDYEFTVKFKEENLPLVALSLESIRRMNLSKEERKRRSDLMKAILNRRKVESEAK